jgi:hypothetical protein
MTLMVLIIMYLLLRMTKRIYTIYLLTIIIYKINKTILAGHTGNQLNKNQFDKLVPTNQTTKMHVPNVLKIYK